MAAHERPRTQKLYDRAGDEIALDEVERIAISADSDEFGIDRDFHQLRDAARAELLL
jgi:hypothetical protein